METQIMAASMAFTKPFFKVLWIVNAVFIIALTVCYFNQVFHMVMSVVVGKKRYKETETRHKYAFLIAARNEEKVIGDLINSIKKQNYPQELIHVFVVADNCTDHTSREAQTAGAIVFERFDDENIGKSYAMEYAFKRIMEEYKDLDIDGYFIFDADNLLHPDFTKGGHLSLSLLKRPSLTQWGMFVHILPLPAISFLWFFVYTMIGLAYFVLSTVSFDVYLHECLRYCASMKMSFALRTTIVVMDDWYALCILQGNDMIFLKKHAHPINPFRTFAAKSVGSLMFADASCESSDYQTA